MKGNVLKNPLLHFTLILLALSYYVNFRDKKWESNIINGDGLGYYYYLPTFLNQDFTYQQTLQAEKKFFGVNKRNDILIKTDTKHVINKYYPGVAILQLPFFLLAYLISYLFQGDLSGYSPIFIGLFYIGNLVYTIAGVYFLKQVLSTYFSNIKLIWISIFALFFGTNLVYITLASSAFTHSYSFFLLTLFCLLIIRFQETPQKKLIVLLGAVLGLIILVRPLNVLIILFIPFLLQKSENLSSQIRTFFSWDKRYLIYLLIPVLFFVFIYLRIVKLQTGYCFYWSYGGEGFNFLKPRFLATLWSYHAGIFVHFPILILSAFGLYFVYKKSVYQCWTWMGFFCLVTYFISSWWCWDYNYSFGNRAFSEYFFLFSFPLINLLEKIKTSVGFSLIALCLLYFSMRFYQKVEDIFPNQKFTATTYWKSCFDFNKKDPPKYQFISVIKPYGSLLKKTELFPQERNVNFNSDKEFACATTFYFPKQRLHHKFLFEISFDKKLHKAEGNSAISLVFDGVNTKTGVHNYYSNPLYEHLSEGVNQWKKIETSDIIGALADSLEKVTIYIWNHEKKQLKIKNYRIFVSEFGN